MSKRHFINEFAFVKSKDLANVQAFIIQAHHVHIGNESGPHWV